jgi:MFS family permease
MLTDRGISLQFATLLVSLSSLSLIVATVASGFLLDRFPVSFVCAGFFLAPCLGIILLSAEATSAGLAVGSFCLGLGKGAEGVVVPFLVGRYFGLPRFGETIGYVIAASVFGFGLGPWLMALCYDLRHSYALVLTAFCLALVIGALLIAFLESHVRREPSVIGVGNG